MMSFTLSECLSSSRCIFDVLPKISPINARSSEACFSGQLSIWFCYNSCLEAFGGRSRKIECMDIRLHSVDKYGMRAEIDGEHVVRLF